MRLRARLRPVPLRQRAFQDYHRFVSPTLGAEVRKFARELEGRRVLHINSSERGGGVATLLATELPLLRGLGVQCAWHVLDAPTGFFEATKRIHNGLQGDPDPPPRGLWSAYEKINRALARDVDATAWDLIVVHDPQPALTIRFTPQANACRWIWRCHIDVSHANPQYRKHFVPYVADYDALVFSLPEYALSNGGARPVAISPAIDPLESKNAPIPPLRARAIVRRYGIDPARPLVTQVSRFDPWKDPLGVVEAWREARRHVAGLQLALVGDLPKDDPEGARLLRRVQNVANGQRDLHVIADRADDRAVNAFQTASDVVMQKSLREGFGLTVSEALWAGTPVIGGAAGGIVHQIRPGRTGYLVETPREAGDRLVELLKHPKRARRMGRAGRQDVRKRFLLPRLIRDDLKLWARVLRGRPGRS